MHFSIFDDDGGLGRAPSVLPGGDPFFSNPGGVNTGSAVGALVDPPAAAPQPSLLPPGWSIFRPDGTILGFSPLVVLGVAGVGLYLLTKK